MTVEAAASRSPKPQANRQSEIGPRLARPRITALVEWPIRSAGSVSFPTRRSRDTW